MYTIGYDVGSSSVKAALLELGSGRIVGSAASPEVELEIVSPRSGFAEQKPETWWEHIKIATAKLMSGSSVDKADVKAVGISYQMHGLVLVDRNLEVLRPAIIWCDSRAVDIGDRAAEKIGRHKCLERLLNSPGNFTASKLKWVKDNEPDIYSRIYKAMLPGDYISMKMTGDIYTTRSGLSEAILWDFKAGRRADIVLDCFGIDGELLPDVVETFGDQGRLSSKAASELGLAAGTVVSYRGGDQPNNALSLGVLSPGEVAATAGTSGVVCGVTDLCNYDAQSRVNTFVHVNHTQAEPRYSVLLCVNGTGILNSWLKHNVSGMDYPAMNDLAGRVRIGSDGLVVLPYGNGAERTLGNRNIGASVHGLDFNVHRREHLLRAGQEGIVFALNYGLQIMRDMGIDIKKARAGNANMFLSPIFSQAFACLSGATVELYNTDGSGGAARGAGIGAGMYAGFDEAFAGLKTTKTIEPDEKLAKEYAAAYNKWLEVLNSEL